jgi:ankyrin repeat protein
MDPFAKGWKITNKIKKIRKIDQDLLNAAYFGNDRNVRKYINAGGDINYMEERDGWLGIHYAARWGNVPMLIAYLKAGADVDGKTKNKETSLHKCARWNIKECAIILLQKGANPTIKNSDGNIPSEMTNDAEMKFLLDHFEEYMEIQKDRGFVNGSPQPKIIKSHVGEYIRSKTSTYDYLRLSI